MGAVRQERADTRNRLRADLEYSLYHYRDASRRLALYETTLIPKTEESLAASETAFRAGTSDFLDLIDAERTLIEFRLASERARADQLRAAAEIDRLLGRFVIPPSSTQQDIR